MLSYKKLTILGVVCAIFCFGAYADDASDLTNAIQNTRNACSGISESMAGLKKMAGINTVITGAGTLASGVALGTGIAKVGADNTIEGWERQLNAMIKAEEQKNIKYVRISLDEANQIIETSATEALKKDINDLETESKTLGHVRTGTLAGATVADTAGAIIAANNKMDIDLQTRIDNCKKSVDNLKDTQLRARAENTATEQELTTAAKIVAECVDWKNVDLSKIDKRAMGAAISAGAGAAIAAAGTITSASANLDKVREGDANKEKNLNTASNILAGGAGVASLTSTIFNATQISAIKKAVVAADKCEEALR